jgi:hypothetical protein
LTAAFAIGLAFLGDTRRRGAFFADFFLIVLGFLTVVVFLRVAALVTGVFLRFALLCFALLCFALLCFALLCFALLCFAFLSPLQPPGTLWE